MKTAYINGIILDGTEKMEPVPGMSIITDGETIEAVQPAEEKLPEGCEVVDLQGKYIMPGLINLHVHIPANGKPKKKPTDARKTVKLVTSTKLTRKVLEQMYKNYAQTEFFSGVTTLRSVGGVENYDSSLRDKIISGKLVGPTILAGNMAVSVPGGHMAGSLAYEAKSAEEAKNYVDKIAEDKPDLIKLMITGGVLDATKKGEPGVLKMAPELVKAACDEAHRLGYMVAAHVESPEGVHVALEGGVDTIEHGAKPDEELIRLFKEKGAAHVATLSPALPYALFDREISHCSEMDQFNGEVVFNGIIECAKLCLANDIPVGLGNDTGCPYITHYDFWRELVYFCRYCSVSPRFALYSATLGNARIAKIDDATGSIEAGKRADLLVIEGNPLENLKVLRNPVMVVGRGRRVENPLSHVKKMPQVERELDKFI